MRSWLRSIAVVRTSTGAAINVARGSAAEGQHVERVDERLAAGSGGT
ncbi:hypothetical protein [Halobellus salinisoli]